MNTAVEYTTLDTPVGPVVVAWQGDAIVAVHLGTPPTAAYTSTWTRVDGADNRVIRQLWEYFAGSRREFDLEIDQSGTPFQHRVWRAVAAIPFGQTRSYGEIARTIDRPRAVRAVGAANGRNAVPIVVPCHRVIAADGTLHGYAAGLEMKAALLDFERSGVWGPAPRLDL
jgi:methylated-DNA-[protein]-cysteine S-methyltransferase